MPFAATWMQLEIIILSEVNQKERQIPYNITYMQNLKCDASELIYEIETDSQIQRTDLFAKESREGRTGSLGSVGANYYL